MPAVAVRLVRDPKLGREGEVDREPSRVPRVPCLGAFDERRDRVGEFGLGSDREDADGKRCERGHQGALARDAAIRAGSWSGRGPVRPPHDGHVSTSRHW